MSKIHQRYWGPSTHLTVPASSALVALDLVATFGNEIWVVELLQAVLITEKVETPFGDVYTFNFWLSDVCGCLAVHGNSDDGVWIGRFGAHVDSPGDGVSPGGDARRSCQARSLASDWL